MDTSREAARKDAQAHLAEFGKYIRRLRRERDWTQDDLADKARLDPRVIRFVESGTRDVGVSTLWMLAGAFGLDVTEMLPTPK